MFDKYNIISIQTRQFALPKDKEVTHFFIQGMNPGLMDQYGISINLLRKRMHEIEIRRLRIKGHETTKRMFNRHLH